MTRLFNLLITKAEAPPQGYWIAADADTTIDNCDISLSKVSADEVRTNDGHVAVDEEQVFVLGLEGQEVADGCTAYIFTPDDVSAAGKGSDGAVGFNEVRICRTIFCYDDFVGDDGSFQLGLQLSDQRQTQMVVVGNQDGYCCDFTHFRGKGTKYLGKSFVVWWKNRTFAPAFTR